MVLFSIWANDLGAKWPNLKTNLSKFFLQIYCKKRLESPCNFLIERPPVKVIKTIIIETDGTTYRAIFSGHKTILQNDLKILHFTYCITKYYSIVMLMVRTWLTICALRCCTVILHIRLYLLSPDIHRPHHSGWLLAATMYMYIFVVFQILMLKANVNSKECEPHSVMFKSE